MASNEKYNLTMTVSEVDAALLAAKNAVTYEPQTLTPEQQAQATKNIGAVLFNETFDVVKTVTTGKNLLNVNAPMPDPDDVYSGGFLRGYRFEDTGSIITHGDSSVTDYIPVRPGKCIAFSTNSTGERKAMTARRVMGYDAEKQLIGLLMANSNGLEVWRQADAAYIRLQFENTQIDAEGQVEYADAWNGRTEYEPYTESVVAESYYLKKAIMPEILRAVVSYNKQNLSQEEQAQVRDNIGISMTELSNNKAMFDDSFNYVAYSNVTGSAGYINTAEHFKWAAKQGFTALKGDIQPTSDGKLVMCHDAGFTLNSDGQIVTYDEANSTPIHDMTEAQCLALQHRNGNHVCPFETYIRICKRYGKIAYITIRSAYMDIVVPEMFKILDKYSMRKRCIVNSFTVASLRAVRAMDNGITLSNVLNYETVLTKAHIDTAISLGNCQICSFFFTASTVSEDTNGDGVMDGFDWLEQSKEALSYAHEKDIRVYSACHYGDVDIDKLLQYGIVGAQLAIVPGVD